MNFNLLKLNLKAFMKRNNIKEVVGKVGVGKESGMIFDYLSNII
jgi:RIO-like serine/threonine protein kinase